MLTIEVFHLMDVFSCFRSQLANQYIFVIIGHYSKSKLALTEIEIILNQIVSIFFYEKISLFKIPAYLLTWNVTHSV